MAYNNVPYGKDHWRGRDRKPRKGCFKKVANSIIVLALSGAAAVEGARILFS